MVTMVTLTHVYLVNLLCVALCAYRYYGDTSMYTVIMLVQVHVSVYVVLYLLTFANMFLSFSAKSSPLFTFIRFLSSNFKANL